MSHAASLSDAKRKLLESYLQGQGIHSLAPAFAVKRRPAGIQAPLSLVQEQVWRRAVSGDSVPSFYNESITIHRTGELNTEILERCFGEIISRHEAWRTTFDTVAGEPIQRIHAAPSRIEIPWIDLGGIAEAAREGEALRAATEDARRPFDLKQGPLVRMLLATISERRHQLFLTMHQSIVDGVSVYNILPSELSLLYEAYSGGEASPLPDLPVQYADFAYWERHWLKGEVLDDQVSYWRERLSGELPSPIWRSRESRSSTEDYTGAIRAFTLPASLRDGLKAFSQREGVTLFMTLLVGFGVLLSRYTEQNDIVVGTMAPAGRKRPEVQQLLGYFLNPVALRIELSGNPTICELLRQSREIISGALSHDDVPLEHLMRVLSPSPARDSLFRTVITLAPPVPALASGWSQTPMDVNAGWAKWDLYLEFSNRSEGIIARVQYKTSTFNSAMIAKLMQDFERLLEALIVDSGQRVSDLPRFCLPDQAAGIKREWEQ